MKILIIEDASSVVEAVSLALETRWPEIQLVSSPRGEEGLDLARKQSFDAVIIDLGLPDISGYVVLKKLREFSNVPVLILTARGDQPDIIKGLEWGADDYLVKPFRQLELQARINGIIRRSGEMKKETLNWGNWVYDPATVSLTVNDQPVSLSRTEGSYTGIVDPTCG